MSSADKQFFTGINCMDGRIQIAAIEYLCNHCRAEYVDSITEPGPARILAENTDYAVQ